MTLQTARTGRIIMYQGKFVDRDMMQRYLGWGIGHLNPPDFPHEAHDIVSPDADRTLVGARAGQSDGRAAERQGTSTRIANSAGECMDVGDEEETEEHAPEAWEEEEEEEEAEGTGGDARDGTASCRLNVSEDALADELAVFDF
ncbi:hypothetical protein K488DRAFT_90709 [Vararia minispora EC-137]|uniref:Uncharacterized protein n=1 Tax=Vararia minispora EC-137 TaxID=1314806 RepID=A0ACB8Q7A5_9AGAM|nr:hypothetical protein K488DRAFT_90709 [Vararia minispora EC-137]